jgi:hypothetical protein
MIRLTEERSSHIVEEPAELNGQLEAVLDAISSAERVLLGGAGELLGVKSLETGKALVVIYREVSAADGFVITAFLTRRLGGLDRRKQIWPPLSM